MPVPIEPNLEGLSPITQVLTFMGSLALGIFMWLVNWWSKQDRQPISNVISVENDKLKSDIDQSLQRFADRMDEQITKQFDSTNATVDALSTRLRLLELSVARLEVRGPSPRR